MTGVKFDTLKLSQNTNSIFMLRKIKGLNLIKFNVD